MNYKAAMKTPRRGWSHANDEQMLAVLSECLGRACCLRPEAVFEWAKKHGSYRDLLKASKRLSNNAAHMELLVAVLNDLPLEQGEAG